MAAGVLVKVRVIYRLRDYCNSMDFAICAVLPYIIHMNAKRGAAAELLILQQLQYVTNSCNPRKMKFKWIPCQKQPV